MARTIYSFCFLQGKGLIANSVSYTVPSNRLAVVRDLDAVEETATGAPVAVLRNASGGILALFTPSTTARNNQWRGRQIFEPGQTITFAALSGTWDYAISGYLLTTP